MDFNRLQRVLDFSISTLMEDKELLNFVSQKMISMLQNGDGVLVNSSLLGQVEDGVGFLKSVFEFLEDYFRVLEVRGLSPTVVNQLPEGYLEYLISCLDKMVEQNPYLRQRRYNR